MTVLAKYRRLETEGVWRPTPDAQRRDVIVSIGEATLTLSTAAGVALTHWSLPAIVRVNSAQDGEVALFAPDASETEVLELQDAEMISALSEVLAAVGAGPKPRKSWRRTVLAGCVLAFMALVLVWAPSAIGRYTASIVPPAMHANIGADLASHVWRATGMPCDNPAGVTALNKLSRQLFSEKTTLAVVPSALAETAALPGGKLLIGRSLVEDYETPEVLAGYLLAADVRRAREAPLSAFLAKAGLSASLRLLTTGEVGDRALRQHSERIVAMSPIAVSDADLISRMEEAKLPSRPYGYARDISGETTAALISTSVAAPTTPLLSDGEWIALQGICEN